MMLCSKCGFENPEEMRFCGQCATPLSRRCPQCGFANPPMFAFCGQCATSLTGGPENKEGKEEKAQRDIPSGSHPRPLNSEPVPAERRQLTVMFCDLVGSTPLAEKLDPEELREVMRAYQQVCAAVITRFEGHLAKYLGDGLLVYFGYPLAHENDAQRAVRAGLGIVAEIRKLHTRLQSTMPALHEVPLRIRIGIHTGLVVAGEMGAGGYREPLAIVGETPNIAARLQELAVPDTVVMSAATYRLTEGFFQCRNLGPYTLRGIATPMEVYQVLDESEAQSRFEVLALAGLMPLVGREEELGLLQQYCAQTKEGVGQVVLLSGEAGIGKSRLVQALKEHLAEEPHAWLECRCSPYYQNSALYPVIELLQRALGFRREDTPEEKLRKLEEVLGKYTIPGQEVVPLFASLLSLPLPDSYPPLTLTPQRQKQRTLDTLLAWLLRAAEKQPLHFVIEDLHWADPSTLELLSLLIDQGATARVLTLLTFRPEFRPPWGSPAHLTQVMLGRLRRMQVEEMVKAVTDGKALPTEVIQQIVAKTDGVPLFVEELTKMVLESGLVRPTNGHYELTGPLPPLAIPTTLHDSLTARLDRLAAARELAQLGATLGRTFSYELLHAISPLDEEMLQQRLTHLVKAELVYQRGLPPQSTYIFKHALIRDAAYQSLLKSRRQQYHQQIAQVLEERFPETTETQPELLAHHYTEAGLVKQAIPYWQQAGQRAIQRSANVEALSHLTKGLTLLQSLPEGPERTQQELTLQLTLGVPLMATKGWTAPEVGRVYGRALELCRQLGETPQLFPVLYGLWTFYAVGLHLQTAHKLAEQLLRLAQLVQDSALLVVAHYTLGSTFFAMGQLTSARAHLEQGIAFYDPAAHRALAFRYGSFDPGVACLTYEAWALWHLGYPDQALKSIQQALTSARELAHPFTLALASSFAAFLHQYRREWHAAEEQAETAIALSNEHGFANWLTLGTILRGWALAEQGQGDEGIAQMHQGLAHHDALGARTTHSYTLALLGEVYRKAGRLEEGLTQLAEALALADRTEERVYDPELYRLKGQLMLQSQVQSLKSKVPSTQHLTPNTHAEAEAEACFLKAIEIARGQKAKSWELRAVTSLARLWLRQGKKAEARQRLAEVYGWFTEGFATADLQEAGALLAEEQEVQ